jgi:AhpD family alkylhydroperoxidase
MTQLDQITRRRKAANKKLRSMGSEVFAAFLEMEKAAFRPGALSTRSKELIGVGIAVATDCESCIQWHIEQAAAAGAAAQEILEAVEVAMEMGGGRATVSARFALEVMEQVYPSAS